MWGLKIDIINLAGGEGGKFLCPKSFFFTFATVVEYNPIRLSFLYPELHEGRPWAFHAFNAPHRGDRRRKDGQ